MKDIISQINKALNDIKNNKDWEIKSTIARRTLTNRTGKSQLTAIPVVNHVIQIVGFPMVSAMSGCNCTSCRCSVNSHCPLGWAESLTYETVIKPDENKKAILQDAESKKIKLESQKNDIIKKIDQEEENKEKCTEAIQNIYNEINEIALLGHNYVYEEFGKEQIKNLEKSNEEADKKAQKKELLLKMSSNI